MGAGGGGGGAAGEMSGGVAQPKPSMGGVPQFDHAVSDLTFLSLLLTGPSVIRVLFFIRVGTAVLNGRKTMFTF